MGSLYYYMSGEKTSQEYRLKNIDKRRNYFLEEIKQNDFISTKHQIFYMVLKLI